MGTFIQRVSINQENMCMLGPEKNKEEAEKNPRPGTNLLFGLQYRMCQQLKTY